MCDYSSAENNKDIDYYIVDQSNKRFSLNFSTTSEFHLSEMCLRHRTNFVLSQFSKNWIKAYKTGLGNFLVSKVLEV